MVTVVGDSRWGRGVGGAGKLGGSTMMGKRALCVKRMVMMAITALSVTSMVMAQAPPQPGPGQPGPCQPGPGQPGSGHPLPDVLERRASGKHLSLYIDALRDSPGALAAMEAQRRSAGGLTIFAPTDAAVNEQIQRLEGCLAPVPDVAEIVLTTSLLYSAVPGHLTMADLRSRLNQSNGYIRVPTLYPPNELAVNSATSRYPSTKEGVFVDGAEIIPDGGSDVVVTPHVVVQVVDGLLIPPDTAELIREFCGEAVVSAPSPTSHGTA